MIYQVFVGRWETANLAVHSGQVFNNLKLFNWTYLKSLGFTYVYLLGIFDNRGPILVTYEEDQNLKASTRLPSVFALSDHAHPSPSLGNIVQLKELIEIIKTNGLKVICDFVPNHRSLNHSWLSRYPDYFVRDNQGNLIKEFSGDVAKLNYHSQKLRLEMEKTLEVIGQWGFDGVRCDMAHFIPLDFWEKTTTKIKNQFPEFEFFGEVYPQSPFDLKIYDDFFNAGFDGLYESILFKNFKALLVDEIEVNLVCDHLNYINKIDTSKNLIFYFFNHDDYLKEGYLFREALLGIFLTNQGKFLCFNGSLNGLEKRLSHHSFDILPKNLIENQFSKSSIKKILEFFKESNFEFDKALSSKKQVIEIEGKIRQNGIKKLKLISNLSKQKINLSEFKLAKTVGLIHSLKTTDYLNSGECEIFIYEN